MGSSIGQDITMVGGEGYMSKRPSPSTTFFLDLMI